MIKRLIHVYRSLTTFRISAYNLFLNFLKNRNQKGYASLLIDKSDFSIDHFQSIFSFDKFPSANIDKRVYDWHIQNWMNHQFDILGTGWVSRNMNAENVGFLGLTVLNEKSYISNVPIHNLNNKALELLSDDYDSIDWQRDIKSGFVWDINRASNSQVNFLNSPKGVDVKIPWELARLNHIPLLTLSAIPFQEKKLSILKEVRNVICDFIGNNPYNKGINWPNAMEVGIRAVNILMAFDLARQIDSSKAIFDSAFSNLLINSIFEHCTFILDHPEYKNGLTNNHYYSNISALLFIGMYFRNTVSGKKIISIALNETVNETEKQFLNDGANFESSTHYHRLTLEMLLWNIILIDQIKEEDLTSIPEDHFWNQITVENNSLKDQKEKLVKIAAKALKFSNDISKGNGNIAACGDQDSGRYIKLGFEGEWKCFAELQAIDQQLKNGNYKTDPKEIWWVENDLSQRQIQVMGKGIYSKLNFDFYLSYPLENSLSNLIRFNSVTRENPTLTFSKKKIRLNHSKSSEIHFEAPISEELNWSLYPDFGIYIVKNESLFLSVFGTNSHSKKYWSHGKNDKLSFELQVHGKDIIVDPGSFVYSADVDLRNKFRSTKSHSTIYIDDKEQNRWPDGKKSIFNLYNESKCELVNQSDNSITLICTYQNIIHSRTFTIYKNKLEILDSCSHAFKTNINYFNLYSNHYGRWINR